MALGDMRPEAKGRLAESERALTADRALEAQLAMLSQAAHCASEGLCLVSEEGIIQFANLPFAKMHGAKTDSVCGRHVSDFAFPESADWPSCIALAREQGALTSHTRHRRSDGTTFSGMMRVFFAGPERRNEPFLILRIQEAPEGKRLAETLDTTKVSYHDLVETAPDAIIFMDLAGKILLTNAIAAERLGFDSIGELCAERESILDLIAPYDRERAVQEMAACVAQGNHYGIEYDCLAKSGEILPVETSTNVVLDHAGRPVGFISIARDIRRRRIAEQRLQRHLHVEQLLTGIATRFISLQPEQVENAIAEAIGQVGEAIGVDHITVGLLSAGQKRPLRRSDWGLAGSVPSLTDMLQRSLECFPWIMRQLRSRECIRFSRLRDLPVDAQEERAFLGIGPPRSLLIAPMMSRGDLAGYVSFEVMREGHEWDEAVSTLILILAEVFASAISRKQTEEALRESEERFRQLVGSSHAMFWLAAADFSRALYVSPAFAEIWKMEIDRLYADPLCFLAAVHPDDRERVAKSLTDEFQGGGIEFRVVRPDGSMRWLVHKGFPIRNSDGEVFRFAGFAEDVTAHKILEKEILEISSREQRRIGLDLHDGLGQHLAGILCLSRGLAKTLAGKGLSEATDAAEIADLIRESIAHARALARGACPVDLEADGLANALRKLAEHTSQITGIECVFESDESVLISSPDQAEHLFRMAQEAVTNAIKHAEATQIRILLMETGVGKLLQIEDNGKGIAQAPAAGAGMGLRLMEHRAKLANGTFVVKRRFGAGTEVSCLFRTTPAGAGTDEGSKK
jgi:PAS domain S-box-containing protein